MIKTLPSRAQGRIKETIFVRGTAQPWAPGLVFPPSLTQTSGCSWALLGDLVVTQPGLQRLSVAITAGAANTPTAQAPLQGPPAFPHQEPTEAFSAVLFFIGQPATPLQVKAQRDISSSSSIHGKENPLTIWYVCFQVSKQKSI